MKQQVNKAIKHLVMSICVMLIAVNLTSAQIVRGTGANAEELQAVVNQFRSFLGGVNNGVGGSFTSGRREINWDGVPDAFAAPNFLPANFFNTNSPRGVVFGSPSSNSGSSTVNFIVSSSAASGVPVRFGNINPSYSNVFDTFSEERLFTVRSTSNHSNVLTIQFFIPGTKIPATVKGFGAVLSDVDNSGNTIIRVYGVDGELLASPGSFTALNNGLSFVGISFPNGERIARVEILAGTQSLATGAFDGTNNVDLIAMDDFIYGEPRAAQFHSGDFDGDGVADATVFRPSTGNWFTLNSGSNTVSVSQFGLNGDIPLDGDFDGDSRADLAVFRPSVGEWYFRRSSNNTIFGATFGQNGDRPVPADYDKDGKTDIALWRPGNGNYFVLRSSDNFGTFFAFPWGQNGDVPIGASSNQ